MPVQDYYEDLTIYYEIIGPDAFGSNSTYSKGETIRGAVGTFVSNAENEYMNAEAKGINTRYIVTTDKTNKLLYGTIIKREKNEQYLRIKSDVEDLIPPDISSFDWCQVYAEKFNMPK